MFFVQPIFSDFSSGVQNVLSEQASLTAPLKSPSSSLDDILAASR